MWLSVVTIVKDDAEGFRTSLDSIIDQEVNEIELVVIDGSRDQTEIPQALAYRNPGFRITYRWLPPSGIYPAMNAALDECQGSYVYFLNAGDTLYDRGVLRSVKESLKTRPIWAYGRVEIINAKGRGTITPVWDYAREKRRLFARGLFPAHQGTFAQRAVLKVLGGFDTSYSIAADYAMALRISQIGEPLVLPNVIARFHEGGASTAQWKASFGEFHRARREFLRPKGKAAAVERWDSLVHFASVFSYREVQARVLAALRR